MVDTVVVAGRIVKRGGRLVDLDVARIRRLAEETRDHLFAEAARGDLVPEAAAGGDWFPRTKVAPAGAVAAR
ncbi:hypothetical protein BJF78_07235 [Pseudonocardia sp. CNS-139]|nr:hypothetical protein BJF78_07235 [Pseudonocardia sp. CNS-139]